VTAPVRTLRFSPSLGDPTHVARILDAPGVVRDGHFELLAGLHTDRFVAFSAVAGDAAALAQTAGWLLTTIAAWSPTVVVAPSTAGVALGSQLAERLQLRLVLATTDGTGRPTTMLNESSLRGHRALLVNDVVTTGTSLRLLAELATGCGAEVCGATWFASRTDIDVASLLNRPTAQITGLELASWPPSECRLCELGEPLERAIDIN
jgi:orotate phosphoribosyltransferase